MVNTLEMWHGWKQGDQIRSYCHNSSSVGWWLGPWWYDSNEKE